MATQLVVDGDRANADARLAFGAATACGVALCTFVVWPQYALNALPTTARRLHLVTVLVAPLLLVLFLTVGSEALSSWAD